jgi:hypothetical protein
VIILEDIVEPHLTRGSVTRPPRLAAQALAVLRETDFAMWLPRFEALAQGVKRWARHEPVGALLDSGAASLRWSTYVCVLPRMEIVRRDQRPVSIKQTTAPTSAPLYECVLSCLAAASRARSTVQLTYPISLSPHRSISPVRPLWASMRKSRSS